MIRSIFLILFFAIIQSSFAQDKGVVRFLVEVDNGYFEIEVNDTLLLRRYKDTLPVGTYQAKVWSPGYVTTDISFDVQKDKTTEKVVKMAKNNEYIQYEYDYKEYRTAFHKHLTIPLSASLGLSLLTGSYMMRGYATRKTISEDVELYDKLAVVSEVDIVKDRIDENRKKYNRQRFGYYFGLGLTVVGVGSTIWLYNRFKQNYTEPTFSKDSPFKDKFSLTVTPYGCGLAFKL